MTDKPKFKFPSMWCWIQILPDGTHKRVWKEIKPIKPKEVVKDD